MKYGNVFFCGKSGEDYRFEAWSLETRFRAMAGVYFVTRRSVEDSNYNRACHENIYIGQTASLADPIGTHARFTCFEKHGANCVCVYAVESEERRISIENDLLAAYPTVCNQEGNRDILWFDIKKPDTAEAESAITKL
jgi:hypothetical protein